MFFNFSSYCGMDITGHADIDFVDIPVNTDVRLYVDPERIALSQNPYAEAANLCIEDFFNALCATVHAKDKDQVHELLLFGHEPNETHMGLSKAVSCGRGVSAEILEPIISDLFTKRLIDDAIVRQLGDLAIFTPNFGSDRLSDLCVNVIRGQLYAFTHSQLAVWNIKCPMITAEVPVWNLDYHHWETHLLSFPEIDGKPLMLCPKDFVGAKMLLTPGEFLQKQVLEYRQEVLLEERSPLCRKRTYKNGRYAILPPTKKDIRDTEMGDMTSKDYLRNNTLKYPELLQQYRMNQGRLNAQMSNDELDYLLYVS